MVEGLASDDGEYEFELVVRLGGGEGMAHSRAPLLATLRPDSHFIVDRLPGRERITVACGFSGHGFKFASVIGEIQANLVSGGDKRFDLTPFSLGRFSA